MTKSLVVPALVSDAVFKAADETSDWPRREVEIDGRSGRLWVRLRPDGR